MFGYLKVGNAVVANHHYSLVFGSVWLEHGGRAGVLNLSSGKGNGKCLSCLVLFCMLVVSNRVCLRLSLTWWYLHKSCKYWCVLCLVGGRGLLVTVPKLVISKKVGFGCLWCSGG